MLTWAIAWLCRNRNVSGDAGCLLLLAMALDTFITLKLGMAALELLVKAGR